MAGQWRDSGGTVAGQWRDSGGTVAGQWRDSGGTHVRQGHREGHEVSAGRPAGHREGHEVPDTGRDTRCPAGRPAGHREGHQGAGRSSGGAQQKNTPKPPKTDKTTA